MLGDDEWIAIGVTLVLWLAAMGSLPFRRRRVAVVLTGLAVVATVGVLLMLRAGTGHRG